MNVTNESKQKVFIVPFILSAIMWVIFFLPAGTVKFWQGWIFWSGFTFITFFITFYFNKKNPEFLSRRMKVKEENTKKKTPAFFKLFYLGFILPGFDFRFGWSHEPAWLVILSNIVALVAYIFIFLVFRENNYASTVIQVEEEQQVISSGPYRIVRHPMYTGMIMMILFMPLALGSYFSLIPSLFIIPILVYRIKNEEGVLLRQLKGYKEYCLKTRYRLIPFIW